MAEAALRCNLQTCRQLLEQNCMVTSCSHVFCDQHGHVSVNNGKCLACATPFRNKYDFNMIDLQPQDQCKAMVLAGLNPDQVLEIASRSISFFTYQLTNENRRKDETIKQMKEETENLQSHCASLKNQFKVHLANIQRLNSGLKKELNEKMAELEKQREQFSQFARVNKKLQLQLAACKRELLTFKLNTNPKTPNQHLQEVTPSNFGFNLGIVNRNNREGFSFPQSDQSRDGYATRFPHARYSD